MPMSNTTTFTKDNSNHALIVVQIPCLSDNYGYLLHDSESGQTAAIDTPDAAPYQAELARRGWTLTYIWNTHHHWDHTGGNRALKEAYPDLVVVGPASEKTKIPEMDVAVQGGDTVALGSLKATVMDVGGHTAGHIAFYLPSQDYVFVGDALFALGCGRMFEGTADQYWASLLRLRKLPNNTTVFCAHEYTLSNSKFAMSIEPENPALFARCQRIVAARSRNEPTVPSLMGEEKETNPFLRIDISPEIRSRAGIVSGDSDAIAFGKVRRAKDQFRG